MKGKKVVLNEGIGKLIIDYMVTGRIKEFQIKVNELCENGFCINDYIYESID